MSFDVNELPETILNRIKTTFSGCWIWVGTKTQAGYGQIQSKRRRLYVHRVVYEFFRGPIAQGLELDHLCRTPLCCNPNHLEAVTHAENVRRGMAWSVNGTKTHCPAGHPYDEQNTVVIRGKYRDCLECKRKRCREYMRKKRATARNLNS